MLRIAIQKSGRLHNDSMKLLEECGIYFPAGNGRLQSNALNFPLQILFLRDDDIPQYVADGVADAGIVGENIFLEKNQAIKNIMKLGFGQCRLSIAVPKEKKYCSSEDLQGIKIATSYPRLTLQFLKKRKLNAEIHVISGSVEIAPGIGLADAVCDLVSSGSTLLTNGLKEVEEVLRSEAILVANKKPLAAEQQKILDKLLFRINSVKNATGKKYIMLNAPDSKLKEIFKILPGMKSPTVVPLAEKGWSSVQSVVNEDVFWEVIEQLKNLKAEGILVTPIEKMIL